GRATSPGPRMDPGVDPVAIRAFARAATLEVSRRLSARRTDRRGAASRARRAGRRREEQARNRPRAPHNPGGLYADRQDQPRRRHARRRGRSQARLPDAEPRLRPRLHPKLRRRDAGGAERLRGLVDRRAGAGSATRTTSAGYHSRSASTPAHQDPTWITPWGLPPI